MTTRDERRRSLGFAEKFLESLLDKKATPKVPKKVREEASYVLRHYPSDKTFDMHYVAHEDSVPAAKDKKDLCVEKVARALEVEAMAIRNKFISRANARIIVEEVTRYLVKRAGEIRGA